MVFLLFRLDDGGRRLSVRSKLFFEPWQEG
jgi:hypothetical protein